MTAANLMRPGGISIWFLKTTTEQPAGVVLGSNSPPESSDPVLTACRMFGPFVIL